MILQNVPLKKYSNYKIGGPATHFCEFKSEEELISCLKEYESLTNNGNQILVLGAGTNILFPDAGFSGLVLKNDIKFINREGLIISVGAGTLMSDLITFCTQNALSGLEWAGGLPGTVGGAVRGNAGAFLGETGDSVLEVKSLNPRTLETKIRSGKECNFGYRQSVFKNEKGGEKIILSVKFQLKKGEIDEIRKSTQEKIDYRIDRHPLDMPNIGSIFKNVPVTSVSEKVKEEFGKSIKPDPFPVIPVAKLIIGAGLMGEKRGGAMVSTKHPNFIVNFDHALASDVLALTTEIKNKIKTKYGITLEEEIMVL